ncbi:MAG: lysozyme family protein [Ramlibacter sp.]
MTSASVRWAAYSGAAGFTTVGLASLLLIGPKGPMHDQLALQSPPRAVVAATRAQSDAGHKRQAPAAQRPATAVAASTAPVANDHYEQLRSRLRWVQTRIGSDELLTPDLHSRVLLAKSAAERAGLDEVGLSFMDVYGIISAETSWVPRMGASKDGTPNLGIAQFEPATARLLGLRNPNDPVEAIHAAAVLMKEAAQWSADRLDGLKLGAGERAAKLREGVSIYYNLSSKGRARWNVHNTRQLPRETQLHILNARLGAEEAALHEAQMRAATFRRQHDDAVITAGNAASGG